MAEEHPKEIQFEKPQTPSGFGNRIGRSLTLYLKRLVWSFVGSTFIGSVVGTGLSRFTDLNPSVALWITAGASLVAALWFGLARFGAALRRSGLV